MLFNDLWHATDGYTGRSWAQLDRVTPSGDGKIFYQVTLSKEPFAEHPTIDLTREQLAELGKAITEELRLANWRESKKQESPTDVLDT